MSWLQILQLLAEKDVWTTTLISLPDFCPLWIGPCFGGVL